MRAAFRRVLASCSILGLYVAVLTLAAIQPVRQREGRLHLVTSTGVAVPPVKHHKSPRRLLSGIGSWYGDFFDGRETANGEIFNKDALTACHSTLPFGTLVRVINLRNSRSVVVRINDRGIRPDRLIDLSSGAAERIGLLETGIAPVKLEIVSKDRS